MLSCAADLYSHKNETLEENPAGCQGVERLTGTTPDGYSAPSGGEGAFTVRGLLQEGSVFLEELHRSIMVTAGLYRAGNEQEGNGHFIELTHGLEMFVTLTSAARQFPEFGTMPVDAAGVAAGLNDILVEIVAAQEQQDMVLLTDLLEYELAPQVKPWLETFTALRDTREDH